ncbi:MAG: hypothetical protein ACPGVJ_08385 [Mangrovicoccus sp.]
MADPPTGQDDQILIKLNDKSDHWTARSDIAVFGIREELESTAFQWKPRVKM